ncbi:unnamed protein product [Lactuca saligna]|uniref:Uncharacterized protein n=1 Tax=Lactuca saligna TaxID=75948 RepID=A0AA35YRQ0_LACSI|nr:unnamed protein product [Lactuca saligna]
MNLESFSHLFLYERTNCGNLLFWATFLFLKRISRAGTGIVGFGSGSKKLRTDTTGSGSKIFGTADSSSFKFSRLHPCTHHSRPTISLRNYSRTTIKAMNNNNQSLLNLQNKLYKIPRINRSLNRKTTNHPLASEVFEIICLQQGENIIASLARVGDEIQWSFAKDKAVVKLDGSYYFFTLCVPSQS